ncbi:MULTISPECIES: hypothetical protein [unclassified Chryseobacterium]|uniref:hypothetical protein n=1 Tax=unclassified Chryseobacterium TaxID=2593645 RepID=UPI000E76C8D5|nr:MULTISPECIES: hypothetical protein [unclassified Chryseobacterium]MDQ1858424.1 hypothetical protein [Chryseobacterium sp. WLY505]RKE82408.1 hypothetical protein DEU39_1965 [Chryseobacterium sp. AG363]
MKKMLFLPFSLLFIFCSNQMKINKGKDIDIILKEGKYNISDNSKKKYVIINNTNYYYIIDPNGFYGTSYTLENNRKIIPINYFTRGYYSRFDNNDCKRDLLIIGPKESKEVALSLNSKDNSIYDYNKEKSYILFVKSFHNRYNATILGCDNYVSDLEAKGYKVLEDSIVAKIPLVP